MDYVASDTASHAEPHVEPEGINRKKEAAHGSQVRGPYKSEEEQARPREHGLWVDGAPVPAWDWRKR